MNPYSQYRRCDQCVMDTTDPNISFDAEGICNHCHGYRRKAKSIDFPATVRDGRLRQLVADIKSRGKGKPYDCVIGVSGGVDSSYLAMLTVEHGLRPLAIHFDNGWNHELAVGNIEKIVKKLQIDLQTYVVAWPEFRDLQLSFLKASTPDGEVPTDHAIFSLLYRVAAREGVSYVLPGTNIRTESIMPLKWGYGYHDFRYISAVHKQFGSKRLKTFPYTTLPQLANFMLVKRIKFIPLLNFIDYRKAEVLKTLETKLGWVNYGGKHYESIYTRFYQAFVLPRKFNIDKRKAHYSNLICSGQLTRDEAIDQLAQPIYPADKLEEDREYAVKKLGLSAVAFKEIMESPPKTFLDYPNLYSTLEMAKRVKSFFFPAPGSAYGGPETAVQAPAER
jgi:N-acetyl sugar amidotransferase